MGKVLISQSNNQITQHTQCVLVCLRICSDFRLFATTHKQTNGKLYTFNDKTFMSHENRVNCNDPSAPLKIMIHICFCCCNSQSVLVIFPSSELSKVRLLSFIHILTTSHKFILALNKFISQRFEQNTQMIA